MTETDAAATFESKAELLRFVPITLFSTSGTLRLADGRLRFETAFRHKVLLDAPLAELHSLAPMGTLGFHIWHGRKRYRFSVGTPYVGVSDSYGGTVADTLAEAASLPGRFAHDRANRSRTSRWLRLLHARVGQPAPGLRVRRPWPMWAWWCGIVGFTLALVGAITLIVLATA
jgi:hypothetical protein